MQLDFVLAWLQIKAGKSNIDLFKIYFLSIILCFPPFIIRNGEKQDGRFSYFNASGNAKK